MSGSLYDAVGGSAPLLALAHAWHARCLADPLANHPFSHPGLHPQHTERLAAYWAEALGGPRAYTDGLGDETHVERIHAGNGEHAELDERCIELFAQALEDADLPPVTRAPLERYFRTMTVHLAAHPDSPDQVPDDLPLPHWSWDGPTDG